MANAETEKLTDLTKVFKALGHPTRLWIVRSLAEGEKCVCDFVEGTSAEFSAVSQHLTVLKKARVVDSEKRGKRVFYRLIYKSIPWLIDCMEIRSRDAHLPQEEWRALAREHRKAFVERLMALDLD